jgi:hypothetical protein
VVPSSGGAFDRWKNRKWCGRATANLNILIIIIIIISFSFFLFFFPSLTGEVGVIAGSGRLLCHQLGRA